MLSSALVGMIAMLPWAPGPPTVEALAPGATTAFEPLTPCRLIDTRSNAGPVQADGAVEVQAVGRCGVPDEAVAVAVTVTAVRPVAVGYLTAYPSGSSRPDTSIVNFRSGEVVANLQLVQLGEDGSLTVSTSATTHVVVDIAGAFVPVDGPTSAGRYVPVTAERALDTRLSGRPTAHGSVRVDTAVPDDAVAAVINLTTTASMGFDFLSAHAPGSGLPEASALTVDGPGQVRSAMAIVPIVGGAFDVYTETGSHIIVDVLGYFTGPEAELSSDGLFVPIPPARLADTRGPRGPLGGPRLYDEGAREFDVSSVTAGPVGAVAVNVTVTGTEDRGYVVVQPAGTPMSDTSSVNYSSAGLDVANHAVVRVSDRGVMVWAFEATDVVLDITGWFTGEPVEATDPVPTNEVPPLRRVTIIGDSAFAGIRWNGAVGGLQGMVVDHRLESCRRLATPSCRGREGYAPRSVAAELLSMPQAGPEDLLVVTAGYDDWHAGFSQSFDDVVATARLRGFHHIAWVTYRSDVGYRLPTGGTSNYSVMNTILGQKVASGAFPEVRIWDYDADTSDEPEGWFYSDGIHERPLGSWGTADWLSRQVAAFDDRPCPQPWVPGEDPDDPCPQPGVVLASGRSLPDIAALYGL